MEHWARFPGPRAWFPACFGTICVLSFPFFLSGLPVMLGTLMRWIVGTGSPQVWGTLVILIAVTATLLQTYTILEKAQTVIVSLLLVCVMIAAVGAQPSWLEALQGMFLPTLPQYDAWVRTAYPAIAARPSWVEVATYMGVIGGGTQDYLAYVGMMREKRWGMLGRTERGIATDRVDNPANAGIHSSVPLSDRPEDVRAGLAWLKAPLTDAVISFASVLVFALAFMLLGATILHTQRLIPDGFDLLTLQAQFLTRLHPRLLFVYQLGIFTAFFGTIYGAYELYARTTYECFRPVSLAFRRLPLPTVRRWVVSYTGLVGLMLVWTGWEPIWLITFPAILTGVFMCGVWCLAMIWTDRRSLPGPYRMGIGLLLLNGISGLAMAAFGVKAIVDYLTRL